MPTIVNGQQSTASQKYTSGFQAALIASWSIIATAISDKLYEAFLAGAFATPQLAGAYFHDNWWMLLVTGTMSVLTGGAVRTQQKANYIGGVETGKITMPPPPPTPIVVPSTATIVTPEPPAKGP